MSAILALGFTYAARSQACGGINNTITDKHTSSALGQSNMVYGKNSTAIGLENIVSKSDSKTDYAFAIGYKNYATAKLTFAFGDQNTVSHKYSFAFGQKNTVSEMYSFAIGTDNNVDANTSIALGYCIKNGKKYGMTIGMGRNPSLPLVNNTDGIMMGMNSDKPTLFISRSFCDGRTGRVGIGNVTDPQAKLHIKADNYSYDGEDADIMLEPTRADKKAIVYFRDKSNSISVSGNQMTFDAPKYSFTNAGITLGKNTSTQASEISFTGQGGISVSGNQMTFNAPKYSFTNAGITLGKNTSAQAPEISFNGQDGGIISMSSNHIIQASKLHGMMIKAVNDSMNFVANSFNFRGGKIGINCKNDLDDYAVAVNGGLICTRVTVRAYDNWPDFVFAPGHTMMSLAEIERYVNENRHLPGIPSSEEMSEKGLDVAEMDAALLQKIEELTLYIIEQQKQMDEQQKQIDELKQCLNSVVKGDSSQNKQ